jgi:hypothetical protein
VDTRLFVAWFEHEDDILTATRDVRRRGYVIRDAYTPYAVHGLDVAMGLKPSRLPLVCLIFGLFGAAAKLGFQVWTSAVSWPVNIGGKPLASIPAFVPVTFEITVLFAGLGTVATFFAISRLWPSRPPQVLYDRVTNDRFVLVVEQDDASFDVDAMRQLCEAHGAVAWEERLEGVV